MGFQPTISSYAIKRWSLVRNHNIYYRAIYLEKAIKREEKVKQLYNTIFPVDNMGSWKQIGEIVLYKEHVENLLKTCNLLSGNLAFDSL